MVEFGRTDEPFLKPERQAPMTASPVESVAL
jgi:hypothetical protein